MEMGGGDDVLLWRKIAMCGCPGVLYITQHIIQCNTLVKGARYSYRPVVALPSVTN